MHAWTPEESRDLLEVYAMHGGSVRRPAGAKHFSWSNVSKDFHALKPNRRRRTHAMMRNRIQRMHPGAHEKCVNVCTKCGMRKRGHVCISDEDHQIPLDLARVAFDGVSFEDLRFDFGDIGEVDFGGEW